MTRLNRKNIYWIASLVWILTIYSTLYIVRPVCEFLKQTIPFGLITSLFCFMALLAMVVFFAVKIRKRHFLAWLILLAAIFSYIYGIVTIQYPEEKIHFLEYGVLAFLLFQALRCRFSEHTSYLFAFLLASFLGLGDEGIQHVLPNRYYQWDDVVLNSVSSLLGLMLTFSYRLGKMPVDE